MSFFPEVWILAELAILEAIVDFVGEITHLSCGKKNSSELMDQIKADGKKPIFGIYIDCAGRTADYSNTMTEEAAEVQKALNQHEIPLLGFYSEVEIAPFLQKSQGLDWTGVLLVLAE